MKRPIKIVALLLVGAVTVTAATAASPDEKKQELQEAYIKGELSLEELVARKDSVMGDINASYQAVKPILQRSCFDCHSNQTNYPWYHALPVVKGMIEEDIEEGRRNLDLSEDFPFSGNESLIELLRDIREEVEEGKMPPLSYRFLHWGLMIEGEKREALFAWLDSTIVILTEFYERVAPADSSFTD